MSAAIVQFLDTQWIPLLCNTAVQCSIVLGAGLSISALARRASATQRHLILGATLGALAVLPLVSALIPHPIAPHPYAVTTSATGSLHSPNANDTAALPVLPTVFSHPETPLAARSLPISVGRLLFTGWALGALFVLARLFAAMFALTRLEHKCRRSDASSLMIALEQQRRRLGVRKSVTLWETEDAVPMTWGAWRPALLLPSRASAWPEARLDAVLAHEMAHIRRGDWRTQILTQIVCAIYWCHPLVWILANRLQHEAERACDDAVLNLGTSPSEYAGHMLDVIASARPHLRPLRAATPMALPSQIESRVQDLLDSRRERHGVTMTGMMLTLFLTAIALAAIALLQPMARPAYAWSGQARPFREITSSSEVDLLAGTTSVQGPGVLVILNDSKKHFPIVPLAPQMIGVIHDTDINEVVNDLKAASAEAIAVNGHRLVTNSPIRCVGPRIDINGIPEDPPYVIQAIGDGSAMQAALNQPGAALPQLQKIDPAMTSLAQSDSIVIPAYSSHMEPHYARPASP